MNLNKFLKNAEKAGVLNKDGKELLKMLEPERKSRGKKSRIKDCGGRLPKEV
jgi:hypothetical protein